MSRKVFAAGEVLAASDVNNFLMNQTIMSFATSAARATSLPTPVEGMYTHLEDTDSLQFWNGSAWINGFGMTLVKTQTIGTAVSSVVVSDAFSANYDNYRVLISGGTTTSAATDISIQLGSANTAYYGAAIRVTVAGAITQAGQSNTASLEIGRFGVLTGQPAISLDILSPFQATRTVVTASGVFADTTVGGMRLLSGWINSTASFTAFTLIPTSPQTITGGTVYVYGYRKA